MALAALTLCDRERAAFSDRPPGVIANDFASESAPETRDARASGIVSLRNESNFREPSPSRPSCA